MLKRRQKREFTVLQTSSPLFRVIHFAKFLANFSGRNLINPKGLHQSTGKEKEDWTVICLRPPKSVKFDNRTLLKESDSKAT